MADSGSTVSRDGADDTPCDENAWPTPGQLLARILDGTAEERLVLCERMIKSAEQAARCEDCDHRGEIVYLRDQLRNFALR